MEQSPWENLSRFPSILMKVTNLQLHSFFLALVDSDMLHAALINTAQSSFNKLRMREQESDVIYRRALLQHET